MRRIDDMTLEERRRLARWGVVFVICVFLLGFTDLYVLFSYLQEPLGLHVGGMSLYAGVRTILAVFYLIGFLPDAFLCELFDSRFNKRPFRARNAGIILLFLTEFVVTTVALLTLLDMALAESSMLIQLPLTAACMGVALVVMVFTFNSEKVASLREQFKSN